MAISQAVKQVIELAQRMSREGLSAGRSGNISIRTTDGMYITPTGVAASELNASKIVKVQQDGQVADTSWLPSSEWLFHLRLYAARSDVQCIVHTHSSYATSLACANLPIPAFHYMVAALGGDKIPCAPYALFGTEELANHIIGTIGQEYHGCLMQHHGVIACAQSPQLAYERAELIEELAQCYFQLRSLHKNVPLLTQKQMSEVLDKFGHYGQQTRHGASSP
ncbi:MAG: class II aldolase/adducin family protein [Alphaproteobacteria bacterium]